MKSGREHLFRPFVWVHDNGHIEVDWADTYENSHDLDSGTDFDLASSGLAADVRERYAGGRDPGHVLDRALGPHDASDADRLRQLADRIDRWHRQHRRDHGPATGVRRLLHRGTA
jgi:hypothetical protein